MIGIVPARLDENVHQVSRPFDRIKATGGLPSPSAVAQELLRLVSDESSSVADIATVVEKDPSAAACLLKLVNSPLSGVTRKIGSIPQAITLLGFQTVASTVIGQSLISRCPKGPCDAFDYDAFWSGSVGAGAAARHIAHRLKHMAPDEAFTCGLFCQVGRLAFATAYPRSYAFAITEAGADDPARLRRIEREMFQLDQNDLAAEMMGDWQLPTIFCDAVRYLNMVDNENLDLGPRVRLIARTLDLALFISHILLRPVASKVAVSDTINRANRLGLRPDAFAGVFDSIAGEWRSMASIFGVSARRVLPFAEILTRGLRT
ncbi:MAG: HDOD domain-containing protein [Phycisphaerae bacterium]